MNDKREMLKRIISGNLSANAAASQLRQTTGGNPFMLVIRGAENSINYKDIL